MKKINFLISIFSLFLFGFGFSAVRAQEPEQTENPNQKQVARPFKIMQELGLTPEQIQQIRLINQARRPILQDAQRRWREANRNLDLAVYADNSTEEQIRELMKTAQFAQAELLKEKTLTEYLIRKVLTPEQLVRFRQMREQLLENRIENRQPNIQNNPNSQQRTPADRLRERRNRNRPQ